MENLRDITLRKSLEDYAQKKFFTHAALAAGWFDQAKAEIFINWPISKDNSSSIYDLASLSKMLVTTPMIHDLFPEEKTRQEPWIDRVGIELRDLLLESSGSQWWHELSISSLLTHDSGLPAWRNFWVERLNESSDQVMYPRERHSEIIKVLNRSLPQQKPTALENCYSDLGFIILGLLIESQTSPASGLEKIFKTWQETNRLFDPKAKDQLHFAQAENTPAGTDSYIPSAYCPLRARRLIGEVHDENCASLGGACGHAGLFGSAEALFSYVKKLFNHPIGLKLLKESSDRWENNLYPEGLRPGDDEAARGFENDTMLFGHWGFSGCALWIDPKDRRFAFILTNRVYYQRLTLGFKDFRKHTLELLRAALEAK